MNNSVISDLLASNGGSEFAISVFKLLEDLNPNLHEIEKIIQALLYVDINLHRQLVNNLTSNNEYGQAEAWDNRSREVSVVFDYLKRVRENDEWDDADD